MSVEYAWKVAQMERVLKTGMVTKVSYTLDAYDGTYSAGASGSLDLEPCEESEMIPFAKLTESTVLNWIQDLVGTERIEEVKTALCGRISEQHEPTYGLGLPW